MPKWTFKGFSILLGVVLGALLVEALARVSFPHWAPRTGSVTSFWRLDPLLGWSHVPNAVGPFNSHGFDSVVRINSKGFRDVERTYEPDPSKYRIVVLGDSMVWGWGVQQEETFTALMEKTCPQLEVLNLGVSGYGTDQELLLLRHEAVRYRPRLIVLVIMDNDFGTNIRTSLFLGYEKPMFKLDDQGRPILFNIPVPEPNMWVRLATLPVRYSYLLNQVARAYEQIKLGLRSWNPPVAHAKQIHKFPSNYEELLMATLLLEIQKEASKSSAEILLVTVDRMQEMAPRLEEYFRAKHARTLMLDPVFPPGESVQLHFPDGGHWNKLGHQKVSDRLLKYLRQEQLGITTPGQSAGSSGSC